MHISLETPAKNLSIPSMSASQANNIDTIRVYPALALEYIPLLRLLTKKLSIPSMSASLNKLKGLFHSHRRDEFFFISEKSQQVRQ